MSAPLITSPLSYARRVTRAVAVGDKWIGGGYPILVQSMATTDTMDTAGTIAQCLRMAAVGCELLRITAPTPKHAANLKAIREGLFKADCQVPIVADIHFMPDAAMEAALHVEKVRINPGNFADTKRFAIKEYSDAQYAEELERIEERFAPLVKRCKDLGRAIRIGTNHGSLSDRIMNRFGDTPLGMVESALEFLRIARKADYHALVLSMKSSNPKVMVQAYRLLAARMDAEGMDYPLHLGVTEAGDGEDGRTKSYVGMATLLEDGIGDTVRVSLTEDPEAEMPVAYRLANRYPQQPARSHVFRDFERLPLEQTWKESHPLTQYQRREGGECKLAEMNLHRRSLVRIFTAAPHPAVDSAANLAWLRAYDRGPNERLVKPEIMLFSVLDAEGMASVNAFALEAWKLRVPTVARFELSDALELADKNQVAMLGLRLPSGTYSANVLARVDKVLGIVKAKEQALLLEFPQAQADELFDPMGVILDRVEALGLPDVLVSIRGFDPSALLQLNRGLVAWMDARPRKFPLLLAVDTDEELDEVALTASTLFGALLLDGVGDALLLETGNRAVDSVALCYNILQAAGVRVTKTEFISCPSCGRTLFDLQEVTARIKSRTGHLVGVKIAIMGCIVNGPGEMADADFGYVGGAPGLINLYVGKECVEKAIPMAQADERLIELIKENARWIEPEAAKV